MRNLVKMNFNPRFLVLVILVIFVVNIECQETEVKGELTCETKFENCETDLEHILDMQAVTDDSVDSLKATYEAQVESLKDEQRDTIKSLAELNEEIQEIIDQNKKINSAKDENSLLTATYKANIKSLEELNAKQNLQIIDQNKKIKSAEDENSLLTANYEAEISILRDLRKEQQEKIKLLKQTNTDLEFVLDSHNEHDYITLTSGECKNSKPSENIDTKIIPDSRPKWKALKKTENNFVTLTWKIEEDGKKLLGTAGPVVKNWLRSIECMLMSITHVELVEATSFEDADIPIYFSSNSFYESVNQVNNSIAFSDVDKMMNTKKPIAPVYFNMKPTCAKWLTMGRDMYLWTASDEKLVHMKYHLAHEIMHSLGVEHTLNYPLSMMSVTPTVESVYKFNLAFDNFNSNNLHSFEIEALKKLFANNPLDLSDENSTKRRRFIREQRLNHSECEKWITN